MAVKLPVICARIKTVLHSIVVVILKQSCNTTHNCNNSLHLSMLCTFLLWHRFCLLNSEGCGASSSFTVYLVSKNEGIICTYYGNYKRICPHFLNLQLYL